jgi:protein MpaA
LVRQQLRIGTSRQGRPITALHIGDPRLPAVLVVGCIHGSEAAGVAVTDALAALPAERLRTVNLWVVGLANPDGASRGTRVNGGGVDLNRNFPAHWQPIGSRGDLQYSGPAAASEPETVAMVDLLRTVRPAVGIWFHQALALVDTSEGPAVAEDALADALSLPETALTDYPGSAIGFENSLVPRSAFAVELPAGRLSATAVKAAVGAIVTLRPVPATSAAR